LSLCRAVRARFAPPRYRHVLGVARMAEKLARRYGASTLKARTAGLLHDVARQWSPDELLAYAAVHGLAIDDAERAAPVLLHARVGADVARREFGVDDRDTLAAIETHTVAVTGMSDLQKIVFIADSCEPSRRFEGRAALEAAAFVSLDAGMRAGLQSSFEHLKARGIPIAPHSVEVYDQLIGHDEKAI
jgi:predicted HD superfamily hydrolase involved in NAD metabolism